MSSSVVLMLACLLTVLLTCSELESTLRKHATASGSSSSSGAFSGKGQTLGGGLAPPDLAGEVKGTLDKASAGFNQLDPQVKIFGGLLVLYLVFWYLQG